MLVDAAEVGVWAVVDGEGVREMSEVGSVGVWKIGERWDEVGMVEGGRVSSSAASECEALLGGVATVGEDRGRSGAGDGDCLCFWI